MPALCASNIRFFFPFFRFHSVYLIQLTHLSNFSASLYTAHCRSVHLLTGCTERIAKFSLPYERNECTRQSIWWWWKCSCVHSLCWAAFTIHHCQAPLCLCVVAVFVLFAASVSVRAIFNANLMGQQSANGVPMIENDFISRHQVEIIHHSWRFKCVWVHTHVHFVVMQTHSDKWLCAAVVGIRLRHSLFIVIISVRVGFNLSG